MNKRWVGAALVGAGLLSAGCMNRETRADSSPRGQIDTAQRQSETAFSQAADAQRDARKAQEFAVRAQDDVTAQRRKLAEAETLAQQSALKAEQLQASARRDADLAASQAREAQQRALSSQRQLQSDMSMTSKEYHADRASKSGTTDVSGHVVAVNRDTVVLQVPDRPVLNLKINDSTALWLDGARIQIGDLPEGSQVRASYVLKNDQPWAVKIEAASR